MSRSGTTSCVTHGATANARPIAHGISGSAASPARGCARATAAFPLRFPRSHSGRISQTARAQISILPIEIRDSSPDKPPQTEHCPPPAEITPCGMRLSPPSLCPIASATPSALINSPTII